MPGTDESTDPTTFADKQLLGAYQATSGEPGDELSEKLLAEIQRRDPDI